MLGLRSCAAELRPDDFAQRFGIERASAGPAITAANVDWRIVRTNEWSVTLAEAKFGLPSIAALGLPTNALVLARALKRSLTNNAAVPIETPMTAGSAERLARIGGRLSKLGAAKLVAAVMPHLCFNKFCHSNCMPVFASLRAPNTIYQRLIHITFNSGAVPKP
jgi:hypothetical protein